MLILALDTCFARCAACLYDSESGNVLAEESQLMERGHAEALAPMVQRVLRGAGRSPTNVDRIAVTTGPGTFTGLRIGLSFARAFGLARGIPVLGLDTLHALRLSIGEAKTIAIKSGQSGLAYVLRENSELLELLSISGQLQEHLREEYVELAALARWAAAQPAPDRMPDPVYRREPDAKPQPVAAVMRQASQADVPVIAALHRKCFETQWSEKQFTEALALPGTGLFMAEANGRPVGFVQYLCAADEAEIHSICVVPAARRQGKAQALLASLIADLGAKGISAIFLDVDTTNNAARALYRKQGFVEVGVRKGYYVSSGADAVIMRLELAK